MKATILTKKDQTVFKIIPKRSITSVERFVKDNPKDIKAMWSSFKTNISEVMRNARDFSTK